MAAETPAATCMQPASGQDFGQHVAMHAQAGMLGGAMNPGMHQGYSTFVSR